MKNLSRFRTFVVLVAILAMLASFSFAQTSKGSIAGTITDTTGAVVAGATVTAKADLGEIRTAVTGSNGQYRMDALIPSTYTITVNMQGFAPLTIEKIEVNASVITSINGKLKIGSNSETVTVEASAAALQTESGELSHNIGTTEITQLPINSLNPISLALTQPGVVSTAARDNKTNGVSFSVNGTRPRSNNFLIDGQNNNDTSINGQALQPQNAEAISEVVILTNSYGAEFGRGGGSVTNVITKGGTNQFHGAVWDTLQNNVLDSVNASESIYGATRKDMTKYRENTYGFSFGGPVKKDKLFFFGTGQWDKYRASAVGKVLTLPTEAGYNVLKGYAASNPRVAQYLQAIGNLRGSTADPKTVKSIALTSGQVVTTGPVQRTGIAQVSDDRQINARVDWIQSTKNTVSFRYVIDDGVYTPDFANNGSSLPAFDTAQGGRKQNFGIQWTRTINDRMVNEFRFSFGRSNIGFYAIDSANALALSPAISITGFTGYGLPSSMPQGRLMNTFQYQDALSFTRGNHTFKVGADLNRAQVRALIPINTRGTLSYTDSTSTNGGNGESALQNLIDNYTGASGSAAKVFGSAVAYPFQLTQAYYAQDAWKLRSNLTLTYGVRYEYYGTPLNVLPYPTTDMSNPFMVTPRRVEQEPDYNNFAPRVGIAYTPHFWKPIFGEDKTVIRGGYGMYYDSIFNNITINVAASSPNVVGASTPVTSGRGLSEADLLIPSMTAKYSPTAALSGVDSKLVSPITHQWNLDIQRELPGKFSLSTAYAGTRGIRLFASDQLNPGSAANTGVGSGRVNTAVGSYGIRTNSGDSIYHGVSAKLDRRFENGLLLRAAYTYSKAIDTVSEVFTTTGATQYPQNSYDRASERGLSAFDRRQRLSLSYVYDIPKLKSESSWLKGVGYVVNGWQVSGTTTFQTGAPDSLYTGYDTNKDGSNANDRPNLGNPNAALNTWAVDGAFIGKGVVNGVVVTPTAGQLYDGRAYTFTTAVVGGKSYPVLTPVTSSDVHWLVQPGLGNVGRNTFIGEGLQNWDFAVARRFAIPGIEGQQIEFRTEMYNAFNHPNEGTTSPYLRSSTFMDPWYSRDGTRNIRFKLKYSF